MLSEQNEFNCQPELVETVRRPGQRQQKSIESTAYIVRIRSYKQKRCYTLWSSSAFVYTVETN
jgi:hypothetical protein